MWELSDLLLVALLRTRHLGPGTDAAAQVLRILDKQALRRPLTPPAWLFLGSSPLAGAHVSNRARTSATRARDPEEPLVAAEMRAHIV